MIEYPSIMGASKAPREPCFAFDKLDGSNMRVKWSSKKGFDLFGTRTQLIDESHPVFGKVISIFQTNLSDKLASIFRDKFSSEREIVVFGEFVGENSFAGNHDPNDEHKFVLFDVLVGHKNRYFVKPNEFIRTFGKTIEIPRLIYTGNLNEDFIERVRRNEYDLKEGVICKGLSTSGAHRGKVWMCKVKTDEYIKKLKTKFGNEWEKYGE